MADIHSDRYIQEGGGAVHTDILTVIWMMCRHIYEKHQMHYLTFWKFMRIFDTHSDRYIRGGGGIYTFIPQLAYILQSDWLITNVVCSRISLHNCHKRRTGGINPPPPPSVKSIPPSVGNGVFIAHLNDVSVSSAFTNNIVGLRNIYGYV